MLHRYAHQAAQRLRKTLLALESVFRLFGKAACQTRLLADAHRLIVVEALSRIPCSRRALLDSEKHRLIVVEALSRIQGCADPGNDPDGATSPEARRRAGFVVSGWR